MRFLALVAIAVVAALSILASLDPESPLLALVRRVPGRDTTLHFVLMGGLAFFVTLGFASARVQGRGGRRLGVPGCVALVGVAVTLEELLQIAIPDRVFSWTDLSASWGGILAGGILAWMILRGSSR